MSEQMGSYGLDGMSDERPLGADAAEDEWNGMDGLDEGDGAEALEDGFESAEEDFDAAEARGAADGFDEMAFDDDGFDEAAFSDEFDSDAAGDYAMAAWSAFEEELADGPALPRALRVAGRRNADTVHGEHQLVHARQLLLRRDGDLARGLCALSDAFAVHQMPSANLASRQVALWFSGVYIDHKVYTNGGDAP